ncbi:MAG: hypothetical protein Q8R36_01910 [bacterium]|nr:hypothetical protein [bacterium]
MKTWQPSLSQKRHLKETCVIVGALFIFAVVIFLGLKPKEPYPAKPGSFNIGAIGGGHCPADLVLYSDMSCRERKINIKKD